MNIQLLNIGKKYYKTIQVNKKQLRVHRFLVEQREGRKLTSNELVHHIDGDMYNNDLSNLTIVSRSEHIKLHPEVIKMATEAKTKYFIDRDVLNEMFAIKRMTLKEITNIVGLSGPLLFHYIKKYDIKRSDIFCECGAKLKYSKTMMCNICRTRYNKRVAKCQK